MWSSVTADKCGVICSQGVLVPPSPVPLSPVLGVQGGPEALAAGALQGLLDRAHPPHLASTWLLTIPHQLLRLTLGQRPFLSNDTATLDTARHLKKWNSPKWPSSTLGREGRGLVGRRRSAPPPASLAPPPPGSPGHRGREGRYQAGGLMVWAACVDIFHGGTVACPSTWVMAK